MFACSYGAAFGAIQQIPQIVPGVPDVADARSASRSLPRRPIEQQTAAYVGKVQEIGGLFGRFALAVLAVRIVSRRKLLRVFQIPGLIGRPGHFRRGAAVQPECPDGRGFPGRIFHGGPVQLLGQLSAAGLSGPFARNGRGICGQYRRTDDRHFLRLGHRHVLQQVRARANRPRSKWPTPPPAWRCSCTWSAASPASGCRNPAKATWPTRRHRVATTTSCRGHLRDAVCVTTLSRCNPFRVDFVRIHDFPG